MREGDSRKFGYWDFTSAIERPQFRFSCSCCAASAHFDNLLFMLGDSSSFPFIFVSLYPPSLFCLFVTHFSVFILNYLFFYFHRFNETK